MNLKQAFIIKIFFFYFNLKKSLSHIYNIRERFLYLFHRITLLYSYSKKNRQLINFFVEMSREIQQVSCSTGRESFADNF